MISNIKEYPALKNLTQFRTAFPFSRFVCPDALEAGNPAKIGSVFNLEKALPALRAGAEKSARSVPPLVAHIPVAFSQDRQAVLATARRQLGRYGRLPFYAGMFANADFPVTPDGAMTDALLDSLVVSGDEAAIAEHLNELLRAGLDELLVMAVPVADPQGEQMRLARLIGQL